MAPSFVDNDSVYDFVVKEGHGVKGLVDLGISVTPEIFIQPPEERIDKLLPPDSHLKQLLNPIDLSQLDGPNHDQVVEAIVRASEKLGFFQVINHGVPLQLLESLKNAIHRFFDQPTERKALYLKGVSPCQGVMYGTSFVPDEEQILKWKDFLRLFYSCDAEAHEYWPKECKEETLAYLHSSTKLARRIVEIMLRNLVGTLEDSRIESLTENRSLLLNYYPPCPNPELAIGSGRHSDRGIITLLLQDDIGGLQVKVEEDGNADNKEEWIQVPPTPGALIVNVGDALQILSNGWYRSAEHRVGISRAKPGVSIPFFAFPTLKENIGPLPELVERDGATRYREVTFGDYLNHVYSGDHDGKKPLDFAKTGST